MAIALWENPNIEPVIDTEQTLNSVEDGSEKDKDVIAKYNNNPKLAQEEADRIVEGLPDTLNQLTPEQQKQFINFMEPLLLSLNSKELADMIPNRIPKDWEDQFTDYTSVRSNISKLPPDKQEILRRVEKEAISKMTEDSKGALESGWVTMPWESEPDSAPDTESGSTTSDWWNEWNSGSQWWGKEFF